MSNNYKLNNHFFLIFKRRKMSKVINIQSTLHFHNPVMIMEIMK